MYDDNDADDKPSAKKKSSGAGTGLISPGGDNKSYLGHFRNKDVLKRGHNQGAPGGPAVVNDATMNPVSSGAVTPPAGSTAAAGLSALAGPGVGRVKPSYDPNLNPVRAQRQQERQAGTLGTAAGRAEMGAARKQAAGIPMAQRQATARAAVQGARTTNVAARQAARQTQRADVGAARNALQTAVSGVRTARQGVRSAIRSGNVAAAGRAEEGLQAARGARRTARAGVRTARK